MGIPELEKSVQRFLEAGLAESSKRVYKAGWHRYLAFCQKFSIPTSPITQEKATLFMAFLGSEGLARSTIESYLAALRHCQLMVDPTYVAPSFHMPFMNLVLRGIKRVRAHGKQRPLRLPITVTVLCRIKTALAQPPSSYRSIMVWVACCTGFFGFLHCSKFLVPDGSKFDPSIHLLVADVEFTRGHGQDTFLICIKVAKTDQFSKGAMVALGSTKTDLCPVAALLDYLDKRGGALVPTSGRRRCPLAQAGLSPGRYRRCYAQLASMVLCSTGIASGLKPRLLLVPLV